MDLPAELRLQIYGHLVIVGKVFHKPDDDSVLSNPRLKDFRAYRKPDLSILRVSKAVHKEAEEVYLSQNLFVLPVPLEINYDPDTAASHMFSGNASKYVKHISIGVSFVMPDWMPSGHAHTWATLESFSPGLFDQYSREERLQLLHSEALYDFRLQQDAIDDWLFNLKALKTIEVDLMNAYCPMGCCRNFEVYPYLPHLGHLEKIRLLGLRHEKEQQDYLVGQYRDAWVTYVGVDDNGNIYDQEEHDRAVMEEVHKRHDITFGTEGDPWESWKMESEGELQSNSESSDSDMEDS